MALDNQNEVLEGPKIGESAIANSGRGAIADTYAETN